MSVDFQHFISDELTGVTDMDGGLLFLNQEGVEMASVHLITISSEGQKSRKVHRFARRLEMKPETVGFFEEIKTRNSIEIRICDSNSEILYVITGNRTSGDSKFRIRQKRPTGDEVGSISKTFAGVFQKSMLGSLELVIEFPKDTNSDQRALLLAAAVTTDILANTVTPSPLLLCAAVC
ncbi:hypothetical protein BKA69DRAFT_1121821 [Paraphysoderma sedebokerense]|nr:hypothetical protein BKA69DRAFT_1121821 [Paraphysoderma sedebokerense]